MRRLLAVLPLALLAVSAAACAPANPATPGSSAAPSPAASTAATPTAAPSTAATASLAPAGTGTGFYANLSGDLEVPPITGPAMGSASATLSQDKQTLTVRVAAMNTSGAISVGHLHDGSSGTNGDVVKPLVIDGKTGTLTWTTKDADKPLTPALVADLLAGKLYVNLHTQGNQGGELRGQLSTTGSAASALMTGAQEVPAATTSGSGVATAWLDKERSSLTVQVSTAGLTGPITMGHIHDAAAGSNGDIVKPLKFNGGTAILLWSATDTDKPLTPAMIQDFLAGKLYVNVHTDANKGGELRGQLLVP
ncbi:MAG: hypothetical protein JWM80_1041 [Cyanobacteria bacterium RYN_339]|nr:hypothetical protein [Cyanobacteria bacterium RYN_339]